MLTFRIDSSFYGNARQVVIGSEGFRADIYADSVSIPTIGYGYALIVKGTGGYARNEKLKTDFAAIGISFSQTQLDLLDAIMGDLNAGNKSSAAIKVEELDTLIRDISLTEAEILFKLTFDRRRASR